MTTPSLEILLEPRTAGGPAGIQVAYTLRGLGFVSGDVLCRLPETVVGIPGSAVERIEARDELGTIGLSEGREPGTPTVTYRSWSAQRETRGAIRVDYFAPVRVVTAATNNGPLFDLRAEDAGAGTSSTSADTDADLGINLGINGAGICFLALPETDGPVSVGIRWDLSMLPPGSRGISSFGEGDVEVEATVEMLSHSFYLAGPVSSCPSPATGGFALYWLSPPPFDPAPLAEEIERIYLVMCEFFREPSPGHRVFIRKHPYRGTGGTAMTRSFVFGHSDAAPPTAESLGSLLAHETAHNWPRLDGEHTDTAWYSEGTAEYYSILLPYRAGITSERAYLTAINERAYGYYTNPLQTLTNDEAGARFWSDGRAQRVPYGRGLFYLIDLNDRILARSGGTRSVDDLVLTVLERQRAGEGVGVAEWIELVEGELGTAGRAGFDALSRGHWMVPGPGALGPGFTRREVVEHTIELGFDLDSLAQGRVSGLIPGSAAERAGVREGDLILSGPNRSEIVHGNREPVELTLSRAEEILSISYPAHGEEVRSYEWLLAGEPDGRS